MRLVQGSRKFVTGNTNHYVAPDGEGLSQEFSVTLVEDIECSAHGDETVSRVELCSDFAALSLCSPRHRNATLSVLLVERI